MISIAIYKGYRSEDVPIQEDWIDFESFYRLNKGRYYRARKKWKDYKNVTVNGNNINTKVNFIRKDKKIGFTKENTVFTSPSDRMKYHKTAVNIKFGCDGALLGKRDVKNLLKKKGCALSMGNINLRIKQGRSIFEENRLNKFLWKGKKLSLRKIAEIESIDYNLLGNKVHTNKMTILDSVNYCKNFKRRTVVVDGKEMFPTEACLLLSKRYGVSKESMLNRFYKYDGNIERISFGISKNKYAPTPKKVELKKGDFTKVFNSISEAAKYLNRSPSNLTTLLQGRGKTINKHTARFV